MTMTKETSNWQVLPLNNILSWVILEQEIDCIWYTTLTFQILVSFAFDYINLYWKTSEAWTYQLINLVEAWVVSSNLTVADIYRVPIQWFVKIKFLRTWVVDTARVINWSLSTEWRS